MIWSNQRGARASRGCSCPWAGDGRTSTRWPTSAAASGPTGSSAATWDELVARHQGPSRDRAGQRGAAVRHARRSRSSGCSTSLAPVPVHVIHAARDIGRQVPAEWQQAVRARGRRWRTTTTCAGCTTSPSRSFWNIQDPVRCLQALGLATGAGPLPPAHRAATWRVPLACCGTATARSSGPTPAGRDPGAAPERVARASCETELLRRFNAQLGTAVPDARPLHQGGARQPDAPAPCRAPPTPVRIGVPEKWVEWITRAPTRWSPSSPPWATGSTWSAAVEDLRAQVEPVTRAPDERDRRRAARGRAPGLDPAAAGHREPTSTSGSPSRRRFSAGRDQLQERRTA